MHDIIMYAVLALLVIISIIGLIISALRKRYDNIVFPSSEIKAFAISSILIALLFFAFYTVAADPAILYVLAAIVLIMIIAWIDMLNSVIIFDEERISVRSFFGGKKRYNYKDIEKMRFRKKGRRYHTFTIVYFYVGKKVIKSSSNYENHEYFIDTVNKEYKKAHNGQAIPLA